MVVKQVNDLQHDVEVGVVRAIDLDEQTVEYNIVGRGKNREVPIENFALGQLLKFADIKKSQADDEEEVLGRLGDKQLKFKLVDGSITGVVSTDYQDISTRNIHHNIQSTLNRNNVYIDDMDVYTGIVTRVFYKLEGVGSTAGVTPGLYLRNSVFGASALGISRAYWIEGSGWMVRDNRNTYTKYHNVDIATVRQDIQDYVESVLDNPWVDRDMIESLQDITMSKDQQVNSVMDFRDNNKITKEMAGKLVVHIDNETWGSKEDTPWELIRTIIGYSYYGNLSDQNRKKLWRIAETAMERNCRVAMEV